VRITGGRPSIFMRRQRAVPLPQHRGAASMRPDPGIVREFVWQPIRELAAPVFAFGKPWFGRLRTGSACRWWTASGLVAGPTRRRCPAERCWCSAARMGSSWGLSGTRGVPGRRVALKRGSYVRRSNHGSANSEPWCLDLVMCLPAAAVILLGHSTRQYSALWSALAGHRIRPELPGQHAPVSRGRSAASCKQRGRQLSPLARNRHCCHCRVDLRMLSLMPFTTIL
jgi:hypothetical protein